MYSSIHHQSPPGAATVDLVQSSSFVFHPNHEGRGNYSEMEEIKETHSGRPPPLNAQVQETPRGRPPRSKEAVTDAIEFRAISDRAKSFCTESPAARALVSRTFLKPPRQDDSSLETGHS